MEPWPIIKLTLVHCLVALLVSGMFGGTLRLLGFIYPASSSMAWWMQQIDAILAILTATTLAVAFASSFLRIILDVIVLTWKGFPDGNKNFLLV